MTNYLLLLVPKEPKLVNSQLQTIIDICIGIGLISLGSVALPVILNRGSMWVLVIGIAVSLVFWYIAIEVSRKMK